MTIWPSSRWNPPQLFNNRVRLFTYCIRCTTFPTVSWESRSSCCLIHRKKVTSQKATSRSTRIILVTKVSTMRLSLFRMRATIAIAMKSLRTIKMTQNTRFPSIWPKPSCTNDAAFARSNAPFCWTKWKESGYKRSTVTPASLSSASSIVIATISSTWTRYSSKRAPEPKRIGCTHSPCLWKRVRSLIFAKLSE